MPVQIALPFDETERVNPITGRPLSQKPGTIKARAQNHGKDLCRVLLALRDGIRQLLGPYGFEPKRSRAEHQRIYIDNVKCQIRKARHQVQMIRRDAEVS